jgi:hypothetical protein
MPTAAKLLDDMVMRDGLPDHWVEILGRGSGQVNQGWTLRISHLSSSLDVHLVQLLILEN